MKHEKQKILAAFDLETSGLDPAVHDIIEIAIVPLNPDFKRSDLPEFTARIKAVHPENADPESLKISGLNPFEGEDIQKVATDITMWMEDNHIERIEAVGHNLRFDLDFFQIKFPSLSRIFSSIVTTVCNLLSLSMIFLYCKRGRNFFQASVCGI